MVLGTVLFAHSPLFSREICYATLRIGSAPGITLKQTTRALGAFTHIPQSDPGRLFENAVERYKGKRILPCSLNTQKPLKSYNNGPENYQLHPSPCFDLALQCSGRGKTFHRCYHTLD